ncbi:RNA polymerase sigma factor [Clostridium disporicum]|uniref:ECF subfamily RNA polymerase sigma-24 factor n=1 Tax=Clostridium disporicum TaxID=84024 RepID=A0A173ZVY5_9CLOT|nr:sigma-70 family RNA polymerase sigma factor [Clostridium disporicum]CUN79760.1 ECF subfamily RNA polymerase sigma-24 factor [Clostridium disporicum]
MKQMEELYLNYAKTVHKYLICLTNDVNIAEDLTQETFYQASKTIKNFKGECKVSVWLCQIAKYSWYKRLEKNKKYNCDSYEDISFEIVGYQNLELDLLKNEDKMELFKKIHLLDSQSKEIIFLRISGELSFREIGDIFNKSENWARVSFYRAKPKLLEV